MSLSGEVWEKLAMVGFFSSLKTECTPKKVFLTRTQTRIGAFNYIECFYIPAAPAFDALLSQLRPVPASHEAQVVVNETVSLANLPN